MNEDTNIQNSFEFAAEQAKKGFQGQIHSLLELQNHIASKHLKSLSNKKEGAFVDNKELEVLTDWLLDLSAGFLEHYGALDRVNRNAMKLFKCSLKIRERQLKTPVVNHLSA